MMQSRSVLQESFDTVDATENLYISDLGPGTYELVVSAPAALVFSGTDVDYGLSWRFMADDALMGDVDLDGKVGLSDLLVLKQNLNSSQSVVWTEGDLDGNGIVDQSDLDLLLTNFGSVSADEPSAAEFTANAVPEPSTLMLLFLSLGALGFYRIKNRRQNS